MCATTVVTYTHTIMAMEEFINNVEAEMKSRIASDVDAILEEVFARKWEEHLKIVSDRIAARASTSATFEHSIVIDEVTRKLAEVSAQLAAIEAENAALKEKLAVSAPITDLLGLDDWNPPKVK